MFCNLQVQKRATEHLQNWHAAPEQATSNHVPTEKTIPPPSLSANVQPVFDIGTISKTGCTFVDPGSSFLCLGTWLEVVCSGAAWQFCTCILWSFVKIYLQFVEPFHYMYIPAFDSVGILHNSTQCFIAIFNFIFSIELQTCFDDIKYLNSA